MTPPTSPGEAFGAPPAAAAWRHVDARDGVEAMFIRAVQRGWRFVGQTTAVEEGRPWTVRYEITVDRQWRTRRADVWLWSEAGGVRRTIRADGSGHWSVDGVPVAALDGCLDIDLEASACTNTFPVHRIVPAMDVTVEAPAAYVRVADLAVERLEQRYTRRSSTLYDYEAPVFDFACGLRYDRAGLVIDYPGIATRIQ